MSEVKHIPFHQINIPRNLPWAFVLAFWLAEDCICSHK